MPIGTAFLTDAAVTLTRLPALCRSAAETTAEATSRIKPSEVIKSLKSADTITSFDDFLATAGTFLEDEALPYLRTAMKSEADDLARLKKVAGLIEKGSESIGKKLSKAELEAGMEALWREGGLEGALKAIEQIFKCGSKGQLYKGTRNPDVDFLDKSGKSTLSRHVRNHGYISPEDYLKDARNFLKKNPTVTTESFVLSEGTYFRYDTATNEFGIINKYGGISTYFKPDKGLKYWLEQVEKYAP